MIIMGLVFTPALAGGSYTPVKINSVTFDKRFDTFSIVLSAHADSKLSFQSEFSGCDKVSVKGHFDHQRWKHYQRPMSPKTHKASLLALRNAMNNKQIINFGYIGMGLVKAGKCHYKSRGLFLEKWGKHLTVYSVNGRI